MGHIGGLSENRMPAPKFDGWLKLIMNYAFSGIPPLSDKAILIQGGAHKR